MSSLHHIRELDNRFGIGLLFHGWKQLLIIKRKETETVSQLNRFVDGKGHLRFQFIHVHWDCSKGALR